MTIIEQIRAEIERLKEEAYNSILPDEPKYRTHYKVGKKELCEELLSFLSTLESEKPMNLDELMKEAQRYYSDNFEYLSSDQPTLSILTNIARHFAQWGANHTPLHEDTVLFNKGVEEGKRLMMEEAVKTRVIGLGLCDTPHVVLGLSDEFKDGDKVRVIVLPKEDEK